MMPIAHVLSRRVRQQYADAEARLARRASGEPDWSSRQLAALRDVWHDARADVPYYRDLVASKRAPAEIETWGDVRLIPELTRAELQDHPEQFVRLSGPPSDYAVTGGSTGTPLRIGTTRFEQDLMRVVKVAEWIDLGYTPGSRVFLMWGHAHLLGTGARGRLRHLRRIAADRMLGYYRVNAHVLNRDRCTRYAEALIRWRPLAIISYASALDRFARHTAAFRDRFHALGLRFVLATAEPPPRPDTVAMVEDLFGCPVVEEYGGTDFGQVAFKRPHSVFETYHDLAYVEALPDPADGEAPQPVLVSTLYRRYVPLIRYRVGDALFGVDRSPHGHVHRFQGVAGRENDVVVLDNGDAVHSLAFLHAVRTEPDVHAVQVVVSDDGIELCLVSVAKDRSALEARIRRRLGDAHPALAAVRFSYVEDVATTRAGKRRWIVDRRTTQSCAASPVS